MRRSQQDEDQDKETDWRGLPVTTCVFLDGEPVNSSLGPNATTMAICPGQEQKTLQECFKSNRVPIEGHRYDS
jgi:hypothetical protein